MYEALVHIGYQYMFVLVTMQLYRAPTLAGSNSLLQITQHPPSITKKLILGYPPINFNSGRLTGSHLLNC